MLKSNMIGNKITEARKKINISQAQLAEHLFISPQAVGKWERGESMPDIITLNRLAEILGVDLNYFSENFQSTTTEVTSVESLAKQPIELPSDELENKLSWNMSCENLVDNDFSGLKNLHQKLRYSSMQRSLFVGSDMSGLLLKSNNIDSCDFTSSNISNSNIQNSNLVNNIFKDCSLRETEFSENSIKGCDFSGADFTSATIKSGAFLKNTIENAVWNRTSFHEIQITDIVFEGIFKDCFFENCAFNGVKFQNSTLINTFFKNNEKLKRIQFIDCKVDKMTYAFLKNGKADMSGITLLTV
ncbi:helix-turn-helix domain-containing protein [Flavobacterium aestivum]|uniref:helix-turn-helix domain-containing protein n=1 Tax=Flavobacterium aestivum TaxID=3003257 RepID=UPI002285ABA8|nr:pentapeptide repeat-containing protein [Flavobacterium aestivum]